MDIWSHMSITVIKSHQILINSLESEADLSFDSDRAVAEYLAFAEVGTLHAGRVDNQLALDVMVEVVDRLKNILQEKKSVLHLL